MPEAHRALGRPGRELDRPRGAAPHPGAGGSVGEYGRQAASRGLKVLIAGAGGGAHLPGMPASVTTLPVIGVPVPLKYLDGLDSLLSIVQMPAGIPMATVADGGARNAGLPAVRILAASDEGLGGRLEAFQESLRDQAHARGEKLRAEAAALTQPS
ncbi:5-(carboxyamino)imidazole ribonucleotide mutase [Nonomuraea dietziae]|uniref:5-(carboxyamino)imidazole ribonucleotide mutase n=1 Tax=Nonomuraea dietziae TaxID=65515 RepID=UPI00343364C5